MHLTKKFSRVAAICLILKIYPGVAREMVTLGIDRYIMIPHEFYIYVYCVTETKTETIFIPNIKLHKNTSKNNTFFITMSFGMVLISYDLISFHHVCALFIQCLYIQQWPATIAQLFPFVPERIRKCKRHIFGITNVTPWPYHNFPNFIQHKWSTV